MKKQSLRYLVVASALALCFSGVSFGADNKFSAEELRNMKAAAAAPQTARVMAVTREFVGPMDKVGEYMDKFMLEFREQGLNVAITGFRSDPVVVLDKDPGDGPATMQIGLTVPDFVQTAGSLSVSSFEFERSLSFTYTGSYDQLCPVYYEMAANAAANGLEASFPVVMMPIDDPRFIEPSRLRTGMIIPVKAADSNLLN